MQIHKLLSQMRLMIRVFVSFALSIFCAACSTNSSYMGIDFSGASHSAVNCGDSQECYENLDLGLLARLAKTGNKRAQFELGLRFENGTGVRKDWDAALYLYDRAASDTQIRHRTFIPHQGGVAAETTYGGLRPGLDEARRRLESLTLVNGHKSDECYQNFGGKFFYLNSLDSELCDSEFQRIIYDNTCVGGLEHDDIAGMADLVIYAEPHYISGSSVYDPQRINSTIGLAVSGHVSSISFDVPDQIKISYLYSGDRCDIFFNQNHRKFYFRQIGEKFYLIAALE